MPRHPQHSPIIEAQPSKFSRKDDIPSAPYSSTLLSLAVKIRTIILAACIIPARTSQHVECLVYQDEKSWYLPHHSPLALSRHQAAPSMATLAAQPDLEFNCDVWPIGDTGVRAAMTSDMSSSSFQLGSQSRLNFRLRPHKISATCANDARCWSQLSARHTLQLARIQRTATVSLTRWRLSDGFCLAMYPLQLNSDRVGDAWSSV